MLYHFWGIIPYIKVVQQKIHVKGSLYQLPVYSQKKNKQQKPRSKKINVHSQVNSLNKCEFIAYYTI